MANFECKIVKIEKKANHPNADRLTIYNIGGYNCISNKLPDGSDRYDIGDLVVYIPENALLPEWLLKKMDFWNEEKGKGILAGKEGNRVKPLKLRGIFSEGVLYPCLTMREYEEGFSVDEVVKSYGYDENTKFVFQEKSTEGYVGFTPAVEGIDVADFLGITKYEPPIPTSMGGEVFSTETIFEHFDVEPIQKYMNLLQEGEEVVMESKIHGTNCRYLFSCGYTNDEAFGENNDVFICSKGLGDKGLPFKNTDMNKLNAYVKVFYQRNVEKKVKESSLYKQCQAEGKDLTVMCEIYGDGIQDLTYGLKNQIDMVMFDVYVGKARQGRYLNYDELKAFTDETGLPIVDVLYRGPFSMDKVAEYTSGFDTFGKNKNQIREGIVIKPLNERWCDEIGRVMLKSVSEAYKLRKGGTELN